MSKQTSKTLSFILRHKPEEFGLEMDNQGWVEIQPLVDAMVINIATLVSIVNEDKKGRYEFNEDGSKVRATQGHSVTVCLNEEVITLDNAPKAVYHGTATRYVKSISEKGLLSGDRLFVHMTEDLVQAKQTGERHGVPAVFSVDILSAISNGVKFVRSSNGYVLSTHVPAEYLTLL